MVESGSVENRLCKYCSKGVDLKGSKFLKCRDCESIFHYSCSQRVKSIKVVDPQNYLIVCCEVKDADNKKAMTNSAAKEVDIYRMEISYLKTVLSEKDARISELIKINSLLEEKLKFINIVNKFDEMQKKISNVDSSISSYAEVVHKKLSDQSKKKTDKNSEQAKISATEEIVNKQLSVMGNIISLNNDPIENSKVQEEFQVVNRRKREKQQLTRNNINSTERKPIYKKYAHTKGTALPDPDDMFKARPSKMWLYVGKAAETVEETHVAEYIKKKCSISEDDQLVVRKLSLLGRSRAFQVGIDPKYYDVLSNGDFWPNGVIIRRFNFRTSVRKDMNQGAAFLENPVQNSVT